MILIKAGDLAQIVEAQNALLGKWVPNPRRDDLGKRAGVVLVARAELVGEAVPGVVSPIVRTDNLPGIIDARNPGAKRRCRDGKRDESVHALEYGFGTLPNAQIAQLEFETYLEDTGWNPTDALFSKDVIWYHFSKNLLAAGNRDKAIAIAKRITDPDVLAVMLADRRFDGIAPAGNPTMVVRDAGMKLLASTMATLESDPKSITKNTALASQLDILGRPEEALSQINQTLTKAAQLSTLDRRRYDFDAQYEHALLLKAYLLFEFGRSDEALAMISTIGSGRRVTRVNPGISLLMSSWLIDLGRGAEALSVLAPMTGEAFTLEGATLPLFARAPRYRSEKPNCCKTIFNICGSTPAPNRGLYFRRCCAEIISMPQLASL
jgi:hypothetical protein